MTNDKRVCYVLFFLFFYFTNDYLRIGTTYHSLPPTTTSVRQRATTHTTTTPGQKQAQETLSGIHVSAFFLVSCSFTNIIFFRYFTLIMSRHHLLSLANARWLLFTVTLFTLGTGHHVAHVTTCRPPVPQERTTVTAPYDEEHKKWPGDVDDDVSWAVGELFKKFPVHFIFMLLIMFYRH